MRIFLAFLVSIVLAPFCLWLLVTLNNVPLNPLNAFLAGFVYLGTLSSAAAIGESLGK